MRRVMIVCAMLIGVISAFAQDTQSEAMVLYGKAEELYNNGNYATALEKVQSAEAVLGNTNPRLLYLKINCFNALNTADWRYTDSTEASLKTFFSMVDKKTYPKEKYLDMTNVSIEIKDKVKKYNQDFTQVNRNDYASVNAYIGKYPGSPHAAGLRGDYERLSAQRQKDIEAAKVAEAEKRKKQIDRNYRGMLIGYAFSYASGGMNVSTYGYYNYEDQKISGPLISIGMPLGYAINRNVGILSGIGADWYTFQEDDFMYIRVPLHIYYNYQPDRKHRAGVYAKAGINLNLLLFDEIDHVDLKTTFVSKEISAGLSVRSRTSRGTLFLGLFYRSFGNLSDNEYGNTGNASYFGIEFTKNIYTRWAARR